MKYKVKELKLRIDEATFPEAVQIITPGDKLVVRGGSYTEEFEVIEIIGNQIKLNYNGTRVLMVTNASHGDTLDVAKLDSDNKPFG